MVPYPVMIGFVNGLAIVIMLAQFQQLKITNTAGELVWMSGYDLNVMITLIAVTMAIIKFLPKITKIIPSALAGILVTTGIVHFFKLDTKTVSDLASISGSLPKFYIPFMNYNHLKL